MPLVSSNPSSPFSIHLLEGGVSEDPASYELLTRRTIRRSPRPFKIRVDLRHDNTKSPVKTCHQARIITSAKLYEANLNFTCHDPASDGVPELTLRNQGQLSQSSLYFALNTSNRH